MGENLVGPAAMAWGGGLLMGLLVAAAAALWRARRRPAKAVPALPAEWAVVPRPVFNTDERRLRRQLQEAFPQHVVVPKLQLIRFCQADDPREMRYWYDLLSPLYVSFAVCSDNGRVLAAIDIEAHPGRDKTKSERRSAQIKQAVLEACRVRYARSPAGQLPTLAELQALLPESAAPLASAAAQAVRDARHQLAQTVATRRRERARGEPALETNDFQDSFFSIDRRFDPTTPSGFDILSPEPQVPDLDRARRAHGIDTERGARGLELPVLRIEVPNQ